MRIISKICVLILKMSLRAPFTLWRQKRDNIVALFVTYCSRLCPSDTEISFSWKVKWNFGFSDKRKRAIHICHFQFCQCEDAALSLSMSWVTHYVQCSFCCTHLHTLRKLDSPAESSEHFPKEEDSQNRCVWSWTTSRRLYFKTIFGYRSGLDNLCFNNDLIK